MAKKVGELFVELAVDATSGNLSVKQLVGVLGELDVASVGAAALMGKVAQALYDMAKAAMQTAVELTALQDITGEDPKIVQQWEKAAERVVHHSGSIVKALRTVHDMNVGLSVGQAPPAALTGLLGLSPYKAGPNGTTVTKDLFDYLKELAAPGSMYRGRPRDVQQQGLREMFGGAGEDMFRVINTMIAGKFHPELVHGLNDKQIKGLNEVDSDRIKIGQQLDDIFDDLITSGGGVAAALDSISAGLTKFDHWLESKEGQGAVATTEGVIGAFFNPRNYNPWGLGKDTGTSLAKMLQTEFENRASVLNSVAPPGSVMPIVPTQNLKGELNINLSMPGSASKTKKVFVETGVTHRETWDVTDTMGNTP